MKLKSLILGSVAAAGLSTAGYAADLGVLTSLDVCDALGLSGLTISSDTNCLQLSGGVSYEFAIGDYRTEGAVAGTFDGNRNIPIDNAGADWATKVEAWLKAVGTADSDFGPAKAVIKIKEVDLNRVNNTAALGPVFDNDGERVGLYIDEAYVSVGDTTVIMAGKKGSIANLGDDEPFNYLGLFNSDAIDGKGVGIDGDDTRLGGHVIQVVSDLGNGVNVGVGLENLNDETPNAGATGFQNGYTAANAARAGTLVGVVSYAGEGITAHLTGAAFGILDGNVQEWALHAGATGTFDAFKVRGAIAYRENFKGTTADILNGLASVEGTFDLFKIALSGEVANVRNAPANADTGNVGDYTDYGFGGSIGVNVTEGVAINLGARYFFDDTNTVIGGDKSTWQVAAQLVAAVTETIKMTGEIGGYFGNAIADNPAFANDSVFYGAAELAWAPGGGFTSSLKGEVNSENAYKVTFKAAKSFE
ncbi:hypothetical protein VW35_02760 [Devosia soli]|uniref:Porin domain-containing protein n=1 Tax=Devosia soli TaxID=361041 RepID=A0A0F5LFI8_9HYPH|nr:hypothetical protein [Devosia soli]KKB81098.1 hypothetical protein VW35_02760 [Devosia soli]